MEKIEKIVLASLTGVFILMAAVCLASIFFGAYHQWPVLIICVLLSAILRQEYVKLKQ